MNTPLNKHNYVQFAMKMYDNPHCTSIDEFNADMNRVSYIKRHLRKYISSGEIVVQLLLNQIIIFCNVFGVKAGVRMLFYRLDTNTYSALKTFLVYLNYVGPSSNIPELSSGGINCIQLDPNLVNILRELDKPIDN